MERPIEINARRCGNTTRLVDYYVQELFNNFENFIYPTDHYIENPYKKHSIAEDLLWNRIVDRLKFEHKNVKVIVDYKKGIKIVNTF